MKQWLVLLSLYVFQIVSVRVIPYPRLESLPGEPELPILFRAVIFRDRQLSDIFFFLEPMVGTTDSMVRQLMNQRGYSAFDVDYFD